MNLEACSSLRVLVVGDAIIDRYRFCTALGKATKDSVISARFEREEEYMGGVFAIASHLTDFVKEVRVWHGRTMAINTKYLAQYGARLFSLHQTQQCEAGYEPSSLKEFDCVLAVDYGHGFFNAELRKRVMKESGYLAANAQTNTLNFGFLRINETWPQASLIVCDELEARLAAHDRDSPIVNVIQRLPYSVSIITQGAAGAVGYSSQRIYSSHALNDNVKDVMGAGDAFLALAGIFAAAGCGMNDVLKIGNAAAALKCSYYGHSEYVTKEAIRRWL